MKRRKFISTLAVLSTGCIQGKTGQETENTATTEKAGIQWSYDEADRGIRDVMTTDDAIYLLDTEDNLIKIDTETGDQLWYTSIDHHLTSGPFQAGNSIIFVEEWNGTPKYYVYNTKGKFRYELSSSYFVDEHIDGYVSTGTPEHLILTIDTKHVGVASYPSAYRVDPTEGEIIDSKDWNTYAGISAQFNNGYIFADNSSIQRVDDSYAPVWSTSTNYDNSWKVAVPGQNEIVVDVATEESAGIIHLTGGGEIISQIELRGTPEQKMEFSDNSVTTEEFTFLPICTKETKNCTVHKYSHEQREITDNYSLDGNLISMVPYDGDILVCIDYYSEQTFDSMRGIELQRLEPSDLTIRNTWTLTITGIPGRFIHHGNNNIIYTMSDTISMLDLDTDTE
jgi:hypothetical protein